MDDSEKHTPREYRLIGPSDDGGVSDILKDLDSKQGRQRLQALIAEWLRMENVVVLTAAGCSVTSGGKLMANLEIAVLDTVLTMNGCTENLKSLIKNRHEEGAKPTSRALKSGFHS